MKKSQAVYLVFAPLMKYFFVLCHFVLLSGQEAEVNEGNNRTENMRMPACVHKYIMRRLLYLGNTCA